MTNKWANRLKATARAENLEQSLNSALTITDKIPQTAISSVIVSGQFRDSLKNNAFETEKNRVRKIEQCLKRELTITEEIKNDALLEKINRLISEGAKFEITADDFQSFGLSDRERSELEANRADVLCTLQQMFLQKNLFDHSPELLEAFQTEVYERSATITDGTDEIVFQSVCEVSAEWTTNAIEKLNAGCCID